VGDVVLAGVKQNKGFSSPEEEEARACYHALRTAITYGFRQLMIEGDCQSLICKLQSKIVPNNSLGFFFYFRHFISCGEFRVLHLEFCQKRL